MAGAVHNPSRRALLGAAASVAVGVVGVPGLGGAWGSYPSTSGLGAEQWRSALAAFEDAAAAVEGVAAAGRGLSFEAQEALQGRFDEAGEVMEGALGRLLVAPAPDLFAVLVKVRLIIDHEAATLDSGEGCLRSVERDLLRLSVP